MATRQFSRRISTGIIVLALGFSGCSSNNGNILQGYAEGEFVKIAAPYAGTLLDLKVQRGAQVHVNTALFVLEQENEKAGLLEAQERLQRAEAQLENLSKGKRPTELAAIRAQQDQARAALRQSELDFMRNSKLAATGFISPERLDTARTALARDKARIAELEAQLATAQLSARSDEIKAAEADVEAGRAVLKQAEWKLAQKSVNAPVEGIVQDTLYVAGEWVPAGSPVVTLLPPENIKIRFFVPEQRLASIHSGQAVKVTCDKCGAAMNATVTYISPQAEYTPPVIYSKENRNKLVYLIEARPSRTDAVKLHPGQPLDVTL